MIKFFRKYNKRILAILVVGLMVVFLGGDALQSMLTPDLDAIVIGHAYGQLVTRGEHSIVSREVDILARLGVWGRALPAVDELDYLLLLREARHEGLSPSIERARAQLAGRDLDRFSLTNRVSTAQVEAAMANLLLVAQMWSAAEQSIITSELEIRQAVRDQHEKVTAEVVEIKSQPLINPDEEIPQTTLQDHFQKYREQTSTGEALDFGYLIPDRVQVEYLKITTDQIPLSQPITGKQAEAYWREHQDQFKRPVASLLPDAPDKPSSPTYQTFAEAREDVMKYLSKQAQLEEARIMASVLESVLGEPWLNLATGDSPNLAPSLEAARQEDYYQKVLQTLGDRLKQTQAITIARTEMFAAAEAAKQPEIGSSRDDSQVAGPGQPFGRTTHRVEGLVDVTGMDAAARSTVLTLYQTAPVHTIGDNNLYVYRVIKAEKQHPPASLDEVRERVVADVRALNAFNQAKSHAEQIRTQVSAGGLKSAWETYEGLPEEKKAECGAFWESEPFARVFELFPGMRFPVTVSDKAGERDADRKAKHEVREDEFVNKVYDLAESGGAGALGTIPIPNLQTCFVVRVAAVHHLTPSDYETRKLAMRDQVGRDRVSALARSWFSPEGLRARAEFKPAEVGS